MGISKTLICLANSVRHQERCVAGKEWTDGGPGEWIRPIHSAAKQEILTADQTYQGGGAPKPGDFFRLTLDRAYPDGNQTENHIIDQGRKWEAAGRASWAEIEACIDEDLEMIWTVGDSSKLGENDKISAAERQSITSSLMLVRPANFVLHVARETQKYGNKKWRSRASFEFNGVPYHFVSTDPVIGSRYVQKWVEADYELQDVVLCISMMGTPINESTTKLVAAVLERKNF